MQGRTRIAQFAVVVFLFVIAPGLAAAGGMKITPGKWQFTATTDMPMAPQTKAMVECVTEAEIDPDKFMSEVTECRVSDLEMDESSMSWKLTCASEGGTMTGDAVYTSTGTTVSGSMTMHITGNGQTMHVTSRTEGKRVGDCD